MMTASFPRPLSVIPPLRRRLRLGLRAMLVLVALCAVPLSLWEVYYLRPYRRAMILKRLETILPIQFPDQAPLKDVLRYIQDATRDSRDECLPIQFDPEELKEVPSNVTMDIDGVPLKTSLRLLLKQAGLTYTVKDGAVVITSDESKTLGPK